MKGVEQIPWKKESKCHESSLSSLYDKLNLFIDGFVAL